MPPAVVVVILVFWFCEDFWFYRHIGRVTPPPLSHGGIWFGVVLPIEITKTCKSIQEPTPPKILSCFPKNTTYPAKFWVVLINPFLPLVERCLWNEQRLGGGEQGSIGSGPSGSTSGNHNGDARTATRWMSWRQMVCWRSVSIVRAHSWRFIHIITCHVAGVL